MQHSHNTTHTRGNIFFLLCLSSRDHFPGSTGEVYSKIFNCNSPLTTKVFIPQNQTEEVFAPFGPVKMQSSLFKAGGIRAGAIVCGSLIPPQSIVTKTITKQTPYPELFVSRNNRTRITDKKSKFQISTRVGLTQPHGFSTI